VNIVVELEAMNDYWILGTKYIIGEVLEWMVYSTGKRRYVKKHWEFFFRSMYYEG